VWYLSLKGAASYPKEIKMATVRVVKNTLFVKVVSSNAWGKTTGVLYVGWENKEAFRQWLNSTFHVELPKRHTIDELVTYYGIYRNSKRPTGFETTHYLTLKQYQAETLKKGA
jgi:hypothetical protein